MLQEQYFTNVINQINIINETQQARMKEAGNILANTLENDGLIHVFGCGHSHMLSEEMFFRAGGLVNVNAIFDSSVMLHEGAVKESTLERIEDIAPMVLKRYKIGKPDCMIIASNSGINAYPVQMAISTMELGIPVICISSSNYSEEKSNHSSGKHLSEVCTMMIDNCVDQGDASVEIYDEGVKAGPLSSIASFFIANSIVLLACQELIKRNKVPKIFTSANIVGGAELNKRYIDEKIGIIKHL
ncbi:MAG: SIS domain-containing protein [Anaerolineaceae bacterium]|nr:SIS domain-containing protein [Anaerolineaceae bacterium]